MCKITNALSKNADKNEQYTISKGTTKLILTVYKVADNTNQYNMHTMQS